MSFDSPAYLLFLPVVCLLHWLIPARFRWALLLAASYVFYAGWNVRLSLLMAAVTLCTWLAGLAMERAAGPGQRRLIRWGALTVCLGVLAYFKYFNLLGQSFAALTGGRWQPLDIILPVGISFYTFQAMSYVIDVGRGRLKAERHPGYYALYISFFPQLVAGPIERADALIPQLRASRRFSPGDIRAGLRLMASGFFRKLVIADLAAPFVDAVYRAEHPDGSAVLLATLLFALQIYADFSGYSEIAAGSARLMGIRLRRNFDRPYAARDIRDFWRRWHMSLTVWFTDYVYIPLGGSRRGLGRQLMAATAVFALCGLWHGADWSFLVWGLVHALFLNLHTLRRRLFPRWRETPATRVLMLAEVCLAWVFFRAENMDHALALLGQLFSRWDLSAGLGLLMQAPAQPLSPAVLPLLLAGGLLMLRKLPVLADEARSDVPEAAWVGVLTALALAVLIRLNSGTANAFIYFQF